MSVSGPQKSGKILGCHFHSRFVSLYIYSFYHSDKLETRSNEKFLASVIEIKVVIEILWGQGEIAPAGLLLSFSLFQATPTSLRAILSTDHVPSSWDWAAKVFLKWATCERLSCSWLVPLLPSFLLYVRPFSFSL